MRRSKPGVRGVFLDMLQYGINSTAMGSFKDTRTNRLSPRQTWAYLRTGLPKPSSINFDAGQSCISDPIPTAQIESNRLKIHIELQLPSFPDVKQYQTVACTKGEVGKYQSKGLNQVNLTVTEDLSLEPALSRAYDPRQPKRSPLAKHICTYTGTHSVARALGTLLKLA